MRILVDIDNTMVDLIGPWLGRHNEVSGLSVETSHVRSYDFEGSGVDMEVLFRVLKEPGMHADLPLLTGSVEAVEKLIQLGHEVVFVSVSPGPDAAAEKTLWRSELFPEVPLWLLSQDACKSMLKGDLIIDDNPNTLKACMATGMLTCSIRWPWSDEENSGFLADDWAELVSWITEQ